MDEHFNFRRSQTLKAGLDEVFAFFSDAGNLEAITPPWLNFRIQSEGPIKIEAGTEINYRLRIHGIPIPWTSRITVWEPPYRFIDEQVKGPYRVWVHEHRFKAVPEGTEVADRVAYDHIGGRLVNRLLVAPDLRRIFRYRLQRLAEIFSN